MTAVDAAAAVGNLERSYEKMKEAMKPVCSGRHQKGQINPHISQGSIALLTLFHDVTGKSCSMCELKQLHSKHARGNADNDMDSACGLGLLRRWVGAA